MFISDDLANYLKSNYSINKNCIYITDLDNVRGFCHSDFEEFNNPISRELLKIILNFELASCEDSFLIINNQDNIIPIFEDTSLNTNWKAQIVLPIWFDDHIQGTLIFTNFHKTFHGKHFEGAKIVQTFVEKFFIKQISDNYREEEGFDEE